MLDIQEKDKRFLLFVERLVKKGLNGVVLFLLDEIQKLEDRINGTLKGDEGHTPTDKELLSLIEPLIPEPVKGDRGDSYILTKKDKYEIAQAIEVPIVEKIIEKTEIREPIVTNEIREIAKYETSEQIREKLENLKGDERLDKSAIKGLEDEIKNLKELLAKRSTRLFGGARKSVYTKAYDLTSLVDGSTKAFTLPFDTINVTAVFGTQFPLIFAPTTDWTFSGRTLTLTDAVGAPQSGQTLICLLEVMFYY